MENESAKAEDEKFTAEEIDQILSDFQAEPGLGWFLKPRPDAECFAKGGGLFATAAVEKDHVGTIKYLFQRGVDLTEPCCSGNTPANIAKIHGSKNVLAYLKKHGIAPRPVVRKTYKSEYRNP